MNAFDPDSDTFVFTLEGEDANSFVVDAETGVVSNIEPLDPSLADDGGFYHFDVVVTDECGAFDFVSITVENLFETPL